jgi:hypothetical protein
MDWVGLHAGTACLVLPDTVGDRFRLSPWKQFLHARNITGKEPAIFITGARAVAVAVCGPCPPVLAHARVMCAAEEPESAAALIEFVLCCRLHGRNPELAALAVGRAEEGVLEYSQWGGRAGGR